jgi:quercetin dioxygenase-like cupin family protein
MSFLIHKVCKDRKKIKIMSNEKILMRAILIPLALSMMSCTTVKYYPTNFIESLKHPTRFPKVYPAGVKNIEDVADKNPLEEDEEVKIIHVSENRNSSMHLIQICENGVLDPHYHRRHDKVIYVEKGTSIATVDGSRYLVKPGSILQIPSRTVHALHNTGDETFVAVAIFSPPFDGRDEKFIGGKRKTDRGAKTKRRLVTTKTDPEKTTEKDTVSDADALAEEEIQVDNISSKKLAEKSLHKPVYEEWNTDNKEQSIQSESSVSESKKKSKEGTPFSAEEPALNIRDMHEKLARLFRLKEEGTISSDEYEEKKDAIMKGKDVGELPGHMGFFRDETPLMEDEFEETRYPVYGLKTLDEMMQEDLIPDEYYGDKRHKFTIPEGEITTIASKDTIEEKINELKELYHEGLITEEDYEIKRRELIGVNEEKAFSTISGNIRSDKRLRELKELYDEGLITKVDYEYKLQELSGKQKPIPPGSSLRGRDQDDKLSELSELREQGLISDENYELKRLQLLNR